MLFDKLFQDKNDAFLRNTNKHRAINVILTELKKPGCNAFHSYDDADIDITKLSVQNSLKCLITEISESKDLLVLFPSVMQIIIQNHCTLKVTKSKTRYKTILGSNIYAKLLFLHALTGCDTTSSINGVGKSTVFFEKTFIKKNICKKQL